MVRKLLFPISSSKQNSDSQSKISSKGSIEGGIVIPLISDNKSIVFNLVIRPKDAEHKIELYSVDWKELQWTIE